MPRASTRSDPSRPSSTSARGVPTSEGRTAAVATLNVISGPDAPKQFPLHRGTNLVGRDRGTDVRLSDPLVSKRHAKVNVSDHVELIDDGSANGIVIGGTISGSRFVLLLFLALKAAADYLMHRLEHAIMRQDPSPKPSKA